MFRILLLIRSLFGIALVSGLYGMAWDLATRGEGYQGAGVWFFSGLALLVGFGVLISSAMMVVNIERLKEDYAGY